MDHCLEALKKEYESYAANCNAALRIILARINNLSEAICRSGKATPFNSIDGRIKTFESTINKLKSKASPESPILTIDSIKQEVKDVAGIRIVTVFRDEIFEVAEFIAKIPDITIVGKKDYVSKPKENGYQSLHLRTQVGIYDPTEGSKLIPIEIQIRDIYMHAWAQVEHRVKYKNPFPSPEAEAQFKDLAKSAIEADEIAMKLRDYSDNP